MRKIQSGTSRLSDIMFIVLIGFLSCCGPTEDEIRKQAEEKAAADAALSAAEEKVQYERIKAYILYAFDTEGIDRQYFSEALFIIDELDQDRSDWFNLVHNDPRFKEVADVVKQRVEDGTARTQYP